MKDDDVCQNPKKKKTKTIENKFGQHNKKIVLSTFIENMVMFIGVGN
jgi:hypothetical protein